MWHGIGGRIGGEQLQQLSGAGSKSYDGDAFEMGLEIQAEMIAEYFCGLDMHEAQPLRAAP